MSASAAQLSIHSKSPEAFRTISEVAGDLDVPQHVLRFWESRFAQVRPTKRAGGRRYYRPEDVDLLRGIRSLLYSEGYTIKGVQKLLRERGLRYVAEVGRGEAIAAPAPLRSRNGVFRRRARTFVRQRRPPRPARDSARGGGTREAGNPSGRAIAPEEPSDSRTPARLRAQRGRFLPGSSCSIVRRPWRKPWEIPLAAWPPNVGAWRSLVSALVWGTRGRRFKSSRSDHSFRRPTSTWCRTWPRDRPKARG